MAKRIMIRPLDVLTRKKDRPPLPRTLPGEFFVIEWEKYRGRFVLHVDDEERSSYDLGANIQAIMRQFELWGHAKTGTRAIDVAKEFGAAQAILSDGRVIALYDNSEFKNPTLKFEDGQENAQRDLPKLSRY